MNDAIRKLTDEELGEFVEIWLSAYPGLIPDDFTEERKDKLKERWAQTNNDVATMDWFGYFREGKLLGGMILIDYTMTFISITTQVGGIASVCVDLIHKKEHVAKELMRFSHEYFIKKGIYLTALYPFRHDFYAQMGYGLGKKMNLFSFEPKNAPKTSKQNVYYLDSSDISSILDCFNRYTSLTHGMFYRNERNIQRLLNSYRVVGYKKDGKIQGYIAFKFKKLDNFIKNNIIIDELIYETPEALSELLTFVHIQDDQIHRIVLATQDDHFQYLLIDPRSEGNGFFLTSQESNLQGVGIMYRVINTQGLFNVLKEHKFGSQTLNLKISITDSFLPENDGNLIVNFSNGEAKVINTAESYDVEIKMNVANFSSMIMGVIPFKKLYDYGLADISDHEYLEGVNELFLTESPPKTIEQF